MRIALVVPGFSRHPGDWAIPALLALARQLARNHELHVFSQRYPARGVYYFDGLVHHATGGGQHYGAASAGIWWQTARTIVAQHRQTPFHLLHAFWADEAGFSAAIAARITNRPLLVSLGGGELCRMPDIRYGAQRFLVRRLTTRLALSRAAVVTAGSLYQLELAAAYGVPRPKLRLAALGVDTQRFSPALPLPDAPVIIQAASLLPVKNQALLLEIMARVVEAIPEAGLYLAGTGPCRPNLRQLAQKLKISRNIRWLNHIPYPAMPGLYRQGSLYLQTSHHESQGMAVVEALACGLPVLGTPVGVARDVACRPAGFSKETLAAQAVDLLTDRAGRLARQQQARALAGQTFSLPVTIAGFLNLYRQVMEGNR